MSEARGKGRKDRKTAKRPARPKGRAILTLNAFDPRRSGGLDGSNDKLLRRRIATFGPISMLFYDRPLNFVRGEGAQDVRCGRERLSRCLQ